MCGGEMQKIAVNVIEGIRRLFQEADVRKRNRNGRTGGPSL